MDFYNTFLKQAILKPLNNKNTVMKSGGLKKNTNFRSRLQNCTILESKISTFSTILLRKNIHAIVKRDVTFTLMKPFMMQLLADPVYYSIHCWRAIYISPTHTSSGQRDRDLSFLHLFLPCNCPPGHSTHTHTHWV